MKKKLILPVVLALVAGLWGSSMSAADAGKASVPAAPPPAPALVFAFELRATVADPVVIGQVPHGLRRIVAITGPRRLPQLPNVPTISETFPDVVVDSWSGFFVPAATPRPIVQLLHGHVMAVLADPEVMERQRAEGPLAIVIPPGAVHAFRFAPGTDGHVLTLHPRALVEGDPALDAEVNCLRFVGAICAWPVPAMIAPSPERHAGPRAEATTGRAGCPTPAP